MMLHFKGWRIAPARLAERALATSALLLTLVVALAVVQVMRERWVADRLSRAYTQLTGVKPAAAAPTPRDALVQRLASHRLIKRVETFRLCGVLGDAAIFNDSMMLKAGQSAGAMKVLTIGPDWVEVETEGRRDKLYVFAPGAISAPQPPMAPAQSGRRRGP
jgi:hypothetical protein